MSVTRHICAAVSATALVIGVSGVAVAAEEPGCADSVRPVLDLDPTDPDLLGNVACSALRRAPELVATTPAMARPVRLERDCADFPTQANAQATLEVEGADPDLLDSDHDGVACEQHFGTEGRQVAVFPLGGVAWKS
jgi:hypothetical protein